jgi:hypothetical protein
VWLRGQWATLRPGDIAYLPEGVERQLRNPATNTADAILVHQIRPPQFDLYVDRGFYNAGAGVMNFDSTEREKINAEPVDAPPPQKLTFNDDQHKLRAWNLQPADNPGRRRIVQRPPGCRLQRHRPADAPGAVAGCGDAGGRLQPCLLRHRRAGCDPQPPGTAQGSSSSAARAGSTLERTT